MDKILTLVGTRPQLIKLAPFSRACVGHFQEVLVHSGQHFDSEMSDIFLEELGLSRPHYQLACGNVSALQQIGKMVCAMESIVLQEKPRALVVFGDTNTTLAGALVAAKQEIFLVHIEAGLRSFQATMPEEQNRRLTDVLSDMLFAPTSEAVENLKKEHLSGEIIWSGDIMTDSLRIGREQLQQKNIPPPSEKDYYLLTLHRPINTDHAIRLTSILETLNALSKPVLFPLHPRTRKNMERFGLSPDQFPRIQFLPPQGFLAMIQLQCHANRIITDSGGVQKEAYLNRVPCVTLRNETEWPETLQYGWNQLLSGDIRQIEKLLQQTPTTYVPNIYGDGLVAPRIVAALKSRLDSKEVLSGKFLQKKLFILIPVYNEAKNLPRLIVDLQQLAVKRPQYALEIILSDDGSRDETRQVAQSYAKNVALIVLGDGKNRGPGYAFGTGFAWLEGKIRSHDILVTMEGDNTSRLETLLAMLDRLEIEDWDSVFASPYTYGGGITQTNWFRIFLSMVANLLVRFILKIPGVFTTSSFFRVYRGRLVLKLQKQFGARILQENGFVSMVELLKKMTLVGATISEYPMLLDTSRRLGRSKMRIYRTTREYLRYLLFRHFN